MPCSRNATIESEVGLLVLVASVVVIGEGMAMATLFTTRAYGDDSGIPPSLSSKCITHRGPSYSALTLLFAVSQLVKLRVVIW